MPATVRALYHYPIKGLSAQPLDEVTLHPGQGFPADRVFGFARPNSGFDPENPRPLPKGKFVVLARDAGLARLNTHVDQAAGMLTIKAPDAAASFDINDAAGRADAAAFIAAQLSYATEDTPTLYSAAPHRFTDVSGVSTAMINAISLINTDSVAAFSQSIGHDISPHRFRGNIHFDGMPAFSELERVGDTLQIGEAQITLVKRTQRCPATEVNLETAERDLNVPAKLHETYGHRDMGVYAEVTKGGTIRPGDTIS